MAEDVELNTRQLDKLVRLLKRGSLAGVKIGIFGSHASRSDGKSNAEIGMYHEFGTSTLPQRSFLRVPIATHLGAELQSSGAFDKNALKQVMDQGSITPWLKLVAAVAEKIVSDAFDTGGDGKWPPSDMTHKKNAQTLVETTQLRNSITTEIKE